MESPSAMSELVWNCNSSTFSPAVIQQEHQFAGFMSVEEAEIMAQLLAGYQSFAGDDPFLRSDFSWSDQDNTMNMVAGDSCCYFSDNADSNLYYWPQGDNLIPGSDFEICARDGAAKNCVPLMNEAIQSVELGEVLHVPGRMLPEQRLQSKRKMQFQESSQLEMAPIKQGEQEGVIDTNSEKTHLEYLPGNPQKKARLSGDGQETMKNTQLEKNQKLIRTDETEENMGMNVQSSSSYCSEDDSISSQEQSGKPSSGNGSPPVLNLNGKARAGRGSATDPQSLYARKRRERINERLRILQNLVPNGTKVDISTMLEEAVQYVKFLQLQIKLLSSDDLWMYAPIAYNGMDIGLDLKISPRS